MTPLRIFLSSAQKEFATERAALRDYLRGDVLMRRCFEVFLFEEVPAADRRADSLYLDEVDRCDLYIGLFGDEYGFEDAEAVSPTEREFARASERHKPRLVFVKGVSDAGKHPKMRALIRRAGNELIRRRFTPFDATFCRNATLEDLDADRISRFLGLARRGRHFPLAENTPSAEVLSHLNLLDEGRPTHAAVLLFGKTPQRFLPTSEVKCAHFHGFEVAKPIPSYQVYKGTAFDLVDQARDFVLSKIDLWVGTRAESAQAPTAYEIPQEVVAEAIVNAVCHRDYTSNASVQVMLFKDRLEVWNPGALPPTLTLEALKGPHPSVPANPLIAEPMYLAKYIERMGTGIRDMIDRCRAAGLAEPEIKVEGGMWMTTIRRKVVTPEVPFGVPPPVTPPVTPPVEVLIRLLGAAGELGNAEIRQRLGLKDRTHLRDRYVNPALDGGWIEMTLPDKPNSRLQRYRLTVAGLAMLKTLHPRP